MKTIYINENSPLYTSHMKELHSQGYTIVCSQRSINGLESFTSESIGNGIYYNYGLLGEYYTETWELLDASIIETYTNEYVLNQINQECKENDVTLSEVLEDCTLSELADSLGYQYY